MIPTVWEDAGSAPYDNVIGVDPMLADPENGDYRPLPGSPAVGYGCLTFPAAVAAAGTLGEEGERRAVPARRSGRSSMIVSGSIGADTLWDADTVRVAGDVTVEDGVTLEVASGVRVEFEGYHALEVLGTILAVGTPAEPVFFTSAHPESFALDSTVAGAWRGIRFPGTSSLGAPSRLEHCRISRAKNAGGSDKGGALFLEDFSNLIVRNCLFERNAADHGAALFCDRHASPRMIGCVFTDNHAFAGGSAVYALYSYPSLVNCTVAFNDVHNQDIYYGTGVVHGFISKASVLNGVVWRNRCNHFIPTQLYLSKALYTSYSIVEGGHEGIGNDSEDPLFLFGGGDHPLIPSGFSPSVNTGAPDTTGLGLSAVDLAGAPRLLCGRIDRGAYEASPSTGVAGNDSAEESGKTVLRLSPPRPNPSRAGSSVRFLLPRTGPVDLAVYDASGRRVAVIAEAIFPAGFHDLFWDSRTDRGAPAAPGVYFLRLLAGGEARASKLVLVR